MSDVPSAFDFLHKKTLQSFSDGATFIWFPTVRRGKIYTARINAAAAPISARTAAVIGTLIIGENTITLHATKDEFPYEPAGEDLFYWGTSVQAGKKYRILTADSAEFYHSHYRITAQLASERT